MFKLNSKRTVREIVRGIFASAVTYEVRVTVGNWSPYFGHYQNQKWGRWDSNSCWVLSVINHIETQCEYLWKNGMFSEQAKQFFQKHGYIDSDGDFSFSERFIEIVGNRYDQGGPVSFALELIRKYGLYPRDLLTYTEEKAGSFATKAEFNDDYFNKKYVTQDMKDLARECLKYIKIDIQRVGDMWETPQKQWIKAALRQAPCVISVPVPKNQWLWNSEFIPYDGRVATDHAIELYGINEKGEYLIFDQYLPNLKTLSSDYYIPSVLQGIVTAIPMLAPVPVKQDTFWNHVWAAVFEYFNRIRENLPRTAYN